MSDRNPVKRVMLTVKEIRQIGFKASLKKYGWKLVAGVFCYYLVRDVMLYIVGPWFVVEYLTGR